MVNCYRQRRPYGIRLLGLIVFVFFSLLQFETASAADDLVNLVCRLDKANSGQTFSSAKELQGITFVLDFAKGKLVRTHDGISQAKTMDIPLSSGVRAIKWEFPGDAESKTTWIVDRSTLVLTVSAPTLGIVATYGCKSSASLAGQRLGPTQDNIDVLLRNEASAAPVQAQSGAADRIAALRCSYTGATGGTGTVVLNRSKKMLLQMSLSTNDKNLPLTINDDTISWRADIAGTSFTYTLDRNTLTLHSAPFGWDWRCNLQQRL